MSLQYLIHQQTIFFLLKKKKKKKKKKKDYIILIFNIIIYVDNVNNLIFTLIIIFKINSLVSSSLVSRFSLFKIYEK